MKAAGAVQRYGMLLTALTEVSACQLVGGYEQFRPPRDAGVGAGGVDGGVDSSAPRPACADLPEAGIDASNMRRVSNGFTCFWMDRTEVSRAEYSKFLELGPPALHHASCGDNRYQPAPVEAGDGELCNVPGGVKLSSEPDHPIVCVDWCDALGYCTSLGKSLCKDSYAVPNTRAQSDWYAACSNAGEPTYPTAYPFGNDYKEKRCNDENHPATGCGADRGCTTVPVGSLEDCANAAGVLHLAGNVHEWTEGCSGDECYVRGGSMQTSTIGIQCNHREPAERTERDATIGFRCCHYPP
jgi:formylglycine-generating enzyme required for sulfatase activity